MNFNLQADDLTRLDRSPGDRAENGFGCGDIPGENPVDLPGCYVFGVYRRFRCGPFGHARQPMAAGPAVYRYGAAAVVVITKATVTVP